MEVDELIADIITQEMELDAERVVLYAENYDPPTDEEIYVIIITRSGKMLSNVNEYDSDTSEEVQSVTTFTDIDIEITSKNRDAYERKEEVVMAINSTYAQQKQEEYSMRFFRGQSIMDLSFIEAGSALHRYRIPISVSSVKNKRKSIDYYDQFPEEELINE